MPPDPYVFADALEPELRKLYLEMVGSVRSNVDIASLQGALNARDVDAVVRVLNQAAVNVNPVTVSKWKAAISQIFARTAIQTAASVGSLFGFSFNTFEPLVIQAIQRQVGERIKFQIDDTPGLYGNVKEVVERGWEEGITGYNQARMLRSLIGPTNQHRKVAMRYLLSMRNDPDMDQAVADRNFELYINRLTNWRAKTIARTENIMAANAGRHAAWRQMVADGILEESRMWLEWDVTDDDKLCPLCAPMDGKRVRFDSRPPPVMPPMNMDLDGREYDPKYPLFVMTEKGFPDGRPTPSYRSLKPDPYGVQRDTEGRFIAKAGLVDLLPEDRVKVALPPLHPNCRCNVRMVFI